MPKIPMSDRGFVPHVENNVRMHGAPGMDFGMQNLKGLTDAARGIEGLGQGLLRLTDGMIEYYKQEADTQNKLAAQNAQNLYLAINEELENKMAANPADFKSYVEWADKADQRYLDEVRQYTDQMTEPFRKQFNAQMEGVRIKSLSRRQHIAINAKVTEDYNNMQSLLKDAAARGNAEQYKSILEEQRGVLISEEDYKTRMIDYPRLADSFAAQKILMAEDETAYEKLTEKDENGNYKNFANMPLDYREQCIRAAKTQKEKRDTEEEYRFMADITLGNVPTEENLAADLREGKITPEQFNRKIALVKRYNADKASEERRINAEAKQAANEAEKELKERFEASYHMGAPMYRTQAELDVALKNGEVTTEAYNDFSRYIKQFDVSIESARKAAETEARRADTERAENIRDSYKFDIIQLDFPTNPNEAYDMFQDVWDELKAHVKDYKHLVDLYGTLKTQLDKGLKNEQDEFKSPEGKAVKQYIEKKFRNGTDFQELYYDPNGLFNKEDSQNFQQARYYELYEIARKMLRDGKSASEVTAEINERVSQLNDGKIKNILETMYSAPNTPTTHGVPLMPH